MFYTKKNIILVFENLNIGGIETKIIDIANHLIKNNNVEIILKNKNGHLIKDLNKKVKICSLNPKTKKIVKNILFPFWLAIKFKQKKPDIIISFGNYYSIYTVIAKYLSKITSKIIISEDSSFTKQIIEDKYSHIRTFLIKKTYPYVNKIIVQSNVIKKRICLLIPNIENKVIILENWLPLTHPTYKNKSHKKYDLIYIARLVEQKNPLLFIEIVNEFIKNNIYIKTVMICSGPLQNKVNSLINQYNLSKYIKILAPDSNKFKLLQQSKIFISTSRHDGFPLTILEASYYRCCPICFNIQEIEHFFKPYDNKLLFLNSKDAFNKINLLLNNKEKREEISKYFYLKVNSSQQRDFLKTIKLIENI